MFLRKTMVLAAALICVCLVTAAVFSADGDSEVKKSAQKQTTAVKTTDTEEDEGSAQKQSAGESQLTGEQINWFVISSGATNASSASYQLMGTAGQVAVGDAISASYQLKSGYWQAFGSGGGCCQARGNVNGTGDINVSDLTYLVGFMFKEGPPPPCLEEGNVNGTGDINVSDLTYLVGFMFKEGPAPPPC